MYCLYTANLFAAMAAELGFLRSPAPAKAEQTVEQVSVSIGAELDCQL